MKKKPRKKGGGDYKEKRKLSRKEKAAKFADEAMAACAALLGVEPGRMERPGGTSRTSVRMHLPENPTHPETVIVTRRESPRRARLEAEVLRTLSADNAPVPKLLAFDGDWLVQEDLGGERLSIRFAGSDETQGQQWLDAAVRSLAAVHHAGRKAGLEKKVAVVGGDPKWIRQIALMPARVGEHIKRPAPELDLDRIAQLLTVFRPTLIKWDARPGNASANADGTVGWFDWEHCGTRNRLDDLAWLMGCELLPDWPRAEAAVLEKYLPDFADGLEPAAASAYLGAYGAFHMSVRLDMIVRYRLEDREWWDEQMCLEKDKVGVTYDSAWRTCTRAARWAAKCELTAPLSKWFLEVRDGIPET